jgi:hypothetical protein
MMDLCDFFWLIRLGEVPPLSGGQDYRNSLGDVPPALGGQDYRRSLGEVAPASGGQDCAVILPQRLLAT